MSIPTTKIIPRKIKTKPTLPKIFVDLYRIRVKLVKLVKTRK